MLKVVEGAFHLKKGRFEDNFLVLVWNGELCIREWTSLTSERVKNDPAFAVTMAYANVQTLASKTSSRVYAQVEGERHVYSLFVLLKKIAYQLFKRGYAIETVYLWLREAVGEQGFWWEEWAEGVQPKVVVEEIVRELVVRDECVNEQPTTAEEGIKHLGHKAHREALSESSIQQPVPGVGTFARNTRRSRLCKRRLDRRTIIHHALPTIFINKRAQLYIPCPGLRTRYSVSADEPHLTAVQAASEYG